MGGGMETDDLFVPSPPLHQCHPDASCPVLLNLLPGSPNVRVCVCECVCVWCVFLCVKCIKYIHKGHLFLMSQSGEVLNSLFFFFFFNWEEEAQGQNTTGMFKALGSVEISYQLYKNCFAGDRTQELDWALSH